MTPLLVAMVPTEDHLANAQGEDVVAGIRNPLSLEEFSKADPVSDAVLRAAMRREKGKPASQQPFSLTNEVLRMRKVVAGRQRPLVGTPENGWNGCAYSLCLQIAVYVSGATPFRVSCRTSLARSTGPRVLFSSDGN